MPTLFTRKHTLHGKERRSSLAVFATLSLLVTLCSPHGTAAEQDEWWFDVEVIVFKRNIEFQNIAEKFPLSEPTVVTRPYVDLLIPYIKPDFDFLTSSMPFCRQSEQQQQESQQLKNLQSLNTVTYGKTDSSNTDLRSDNVNPAKVAIERIVEVQSERLVELNPDSGKDDDNMPVIDRLLSVYDKTLVLSPLLLEQPFIDWQLPMQLPCTYQNPNKLLVNPFEPAELENFVASIPVQVNGQEGSNVRQPHLLPQSALLLSSLFEDINRQGELNPILHLGWRQPVLFGKNRAAKFRLFAGNNYADTYSSSGDILATTPKPSTDEIVDKYPVEFDTSVQQTTGTVQDSLFAKIYQALADPSPIVIAKEQEYAPAAASSAKKVNQLWQLDGELKVYLQNVGRTPYLHIDSDLEYRIPIFVENKASVLADSNIGLAPASQTLAIESDAALVADSSGQPNYLQSVKFSQLRRVISKQLHYFDHPLFGMVVHIKRHKWPELEATNNPQNTEN
jgi:hypothetical protein